jgi:hypothetical protein
MSRAAPSGPDAVLLDALWQDDDPGETDYGYQAVIGTLAVALMAEAGAVDPEAFREQASALWQQRDRQWLPFRH